MDNANRRMDRLGKGIQRSVAEFLISGFKHQLKGLVSVSHVDVTKDLRHANVHVSVLGSDEDRKWTMQTLHDHSSDVQRHVAREVRMRYCPRITFREDRSAEHLFHIQDTLRGLSGGGES